MDRPLTIITTTPAELERLISEGIRREVAPLRAAIKMLIPKEISVKKAAEIKGVTPGTIRKQYRSARLNGTKPGKKLIMIDTKEIFNLD